jgi:two-component system, cell cycle response regulator
MNTIKKILLLGFAPFEKSTFESFFRLVGRRETLYQIVSDVGSADVLMVNGDNPTAVQWANSSVKPPQKALYIGTPDPSGKWPTATRPIKLTAVLGLLDVLVMAKKAPIEKAPISREEATIVAPAPVVVTQPVVPLPLKRKGSVRQGYGGRSNSNFGTSNFMGLGDASMAPTRGQQFDDILVVDDSDVALKFMQNRLTRYGFRAELARSGEEALTRVSTEAYKFVFLDVMMEGLDGYQTCRAIKLRKYASGKTPVVVMLTSRGGSIDKIRGGLAGCDAYLTKPLNEAELLKVLAKYDEQVERSFRDTNIGGSGVSSLR